MIKISTPVIPERLPFSVGLRERTMVLGSCFADSMGLRMRDAGFDVCVNPFGTLYNPASICNSAERLDSGLPFSGEDCVQMGAGSPLVCSWSHHTSFARPDRESFLENANASLSEASAFWKSCGKVIVTLGTAMVWRLVSDGRVVSNCLKRPAGEFTHEMLGVQETAGLLRSLPEKYPEKQFLFTVSPIRHLGEGAHVNTLSKATLQLALSACCPPGCYFPAYEIMNDELRDYRFYAEDLVHPSRLAEDIIWQRFLDSVAEPSERQCIAANEKAARASRHREIH